MATEITPLSDIITGWPDKAPDDGVALVLCEDSDLEELGIEGDDLKLVKTLRGHFRRAAIAKNTSAQLVNAPAVLKALDSGDLLPSWGHWVVLVLDRSRRRVFNTRSRNNSDTTRTVSKIYRWVPKPDDERLPHLPEGGSYLLLWGGDVAVLNIDDVRERLRAFGAQHPVADVVFRRRANMRDPKNPKPATTWSLREGIGVCNNQPVEFPPETHHTEVELWNS